MKNNNKEKLKELTDVIDLIEKAPLEEAISLLGQAKSIYGELKGLKNVNIEETIKSFVNKSTEKLKEEAKTNALRELEKQKEWLTLEAKKIAISSVPPKTATTIKAKTKYIRMNAQKESMRVYKEAEDKALESLTDFSKKMIKSVEQIFNPVNEIVDSATNTYVIAVNEYNSLLKSTKEYKKEIEKYKELKEAKSKVHSKPGENKIILPTKEELLEEKNKVDELFVEELIKGTNKLEEIKDNIGDYIDNIIKEGRETAKEMSKTPINYSFIKPSFIGEYAALINVPNYLVKLTKNAVPAFKTKNAEKFQDTIKEYERLKSYIKVCTTLWPESKIYKTLLTIIAPLDALLNEALKKIYDNIRINREYVANRGKEKAEDIKEALLKNDSEANKKRKQDIENNILNAVSEIDPSLTQNNLDFLNNLKSYQFIKDADLTEGTGSEIIDYLNELTGSKLIIDELFGKAKRDKNKESLVNTIKAMTRPADNKGFVQRKYPNRVDVKDLLNNDPDLKINPLCSEVETEEEPEEDKKSNEGVRVIVEFNYNIETYEWFVGPGDEIHSDTILGYFIDKDEEGNDIRREVHSPFKFAYISKCDYKVLRLDFERHYVFDGVIFKEEDKEYGQNISDELTKLINELTDTFKDRAQEQEFIDKLILQYFVAEKIARFKGSNIYIKSIIKGFEKKKENKIKKVKGLFSAFKNINTEDTEKFKEFSANAFSFSSDYIKDLYNLWSSYKSKSDIPFYARVLFTDLGSHKYSKISKTHSNTIQKIINLIDYKENLLDKKLRISEDNLRLKELLNIYKITEDVLKPKNKKINDFISDDDIIKQLNDNQENKKYRLLDYELNSGSYTHFGKRIEVTDASGKVTYENYSFIQDKRTSIITDRMANLYKELDDIIESIFKKLLIEWSDLDKVSNTIIDKFKNNKTISKFLDYPYLFYHPDFIDLDILGTIYPYHLICADYNPNDDFGDKLDDFMNPDDLPSEIIDQVIDYLPDDVKGQIKNWQKPNIEKTLKEQGGDKYGICSYLYWLRHMMIDTVCGLPNLVTWSYAPLLKLPVIYLPLLVFRVPLLKCPCVIGVGVAGFGTYPMVILVNAEDIDKSWLIPLTMAADFAYFTGKTVIKYSEKALNASIDAERLTLKTKLATIDRALKKLSEEKYKISKELDAKVLEIQKQIEKINVEKQFNKINKQRKQLISTFKNNVK